MKDVEPPHYWIANQKFNSPDFSNVFQSCEEVPHRLNNGHVFEPIGFDKISHVPEIRSIPAQVDPKTIAC